MQAKMAAEMGQKVGFLDPNLISKEAHMYPLRYPDDHPDLAKGKTKNIKIESG